MSAHPPFDPGTVEAIAKVLGEAGSGSDINRYFQANRLIDDSCESTKWRRPWPWCSNLQNGHSFVGSGYAATISRQKLLMA
jgi:hypothetical protein